MLHVQHFRAWEFNSSFPLRSIVLPYVTCGTPLWLLRELSDWLEVPLLTSYTVLVAPRLVFTFLSLTSDVLMAEICWRLDLNLRGCLLVYASSYVTLVYFTRTLTNSLEAFIFTYLLCVVISVTSFYIKPVKRKRKMKSGKLKVADKNVSKPKDLDPAASGSDPSDRTSKQDNCPEKSTQTEFKEKPQKDNKISQVGDSNSGKPSVPQTTKTSLSKSPTYAIRIGAIIACGFFNRPTFLAFAVVPYMFWLLCLCRHGSGIQGQPTWRQVTRRAVNLLFQSSLGLIVCSAVFIFWDSFYYSGLTLMEFITYGPFQPALWKFVPLNFVQYNINTENVKEHGLHPRILHMAVNTPLLFNILAFIPFVVGFRTIYRTIRGETVNVHQVFLLCSYFVPLGLLSVFPHQEPRFLLPLLAPLVLISASYLIGQGSWRTLWYMWLIVNMSSAVFYGMVHQGGMVPLLSHMEAQQDLATPGAIYHMVFYHTYMPPEHLLLSPQQDKLPPVTFHIHDLKGTSRKALLKTLGTIWSGMQRSTRRNNISLFLVAPSSLATELCEIPGMQFQVVRSFALHYSGENPPPRDVLHCDRSLRVSCQRSCHSLTFTQRLVSLAALNLYSISVSSTMQA